MGNLPIPKYTTRNGAMNITSYLPGLFCPPDLGPKLYMAYGWATEKRWEKGTTNLHLDISDAFNIMMYVGVPGGMKNKKVLARILKEGDVEEVQIQRLLKKNAVKPGALWHLFHPTDTWKIREYMKRVTYFVLVILF